MCYNNRNMKKQIKYSYGFTLIEVLVVIAIIGILSSVVLLSLNNAKTKGSDVKIKSDVRQARSVLESGYNDNVYNDLYNADNAGSITNDVIGSLTDNGPGNEILNTLNADAAAQVNGSNLIFIVDTSTVTGSATVPNVTAYAVYGKLGTTTPLYFCSDSTSKTNDSAVTANTTVCP